MKKALKVLTCCLFVLRCGNQNDYKEEQIITFNLKEITKTTNVTLSDLGFIDIDYVPLETNEQGLIQRTINLGSSGDKLIVNESYFIIKHYNTILKFANDGSFVAKIGKEGRGPNEYQTCHDVESDMDGQRIYVVDGWKQKLFFYSDSGDFIKAIDFPFQGFGYFRFVNGNFLCYYDNHLGNVEISFNLIDTSGKIIKSYPNKYPFVKYKNDAYGFDHENLFYRFDDLLFKKEVYSDTIYVYKHMEFIPHLVTEVGDRLITPKIRSEFAGLELAKNYISPRNLFEFGEYVYYEFTYKFDFSNTLNYSFIGSKLRDFQVFIKPENGIINDMDSGPNILPLTIKDDNTLIGCVDALQLKRHVDSETFRNSICKYPEKKKELEKLANRLKETDNPVMIIIRLKQ